MNPLILWAEKCYAIIARTKKKFSPAKWLLSFVLLFSGLANYAQAPGGVSAGLQAWYKADAGTTLSGSTVTAWKDESGNGFNTTQGSYTGPTLTNAACNYNPGLTFTSSGNYLQRVAPGIFTSGATYNNLNFYCVYNTSDVTNFKWLTYQGAGTGYTRFSQSLNYSAGPNCDMDFTTNNRLSYPTATRVNVPVIVSYLASTSAISGTSKLLLYLNGGAITNSTSYTPFVGPNNPFEIGNHVFTTGDPAAPFIGNIHEIIVYSGANSITQKSQIESYLAVKYGDTLNRVGSGGNYLNSSGASIYNDGGAATYWNNIIGIARDDNSGLYQKQSHQLDDSARIYLSSLQTTNTANSGTFSSNNQFVMLGNNNVSMANTGSAQYPSGYGILGRMGREWQITNTGFTGTYSIDIKVPASVCTIDPTQLMLIVGNSSNLTTANVYTASSGLTFSYSGGVLTIGNISTSIIPLNSTQYFTLNMNAASVGGTASSAQTICPGSTPSNLTLSGNTGSVIKWQYSTDNFVSNINDIASSANTTLTSTQMGALSVNTYYRAVVQNGACSTANSSVVLITMNSAPTISSVTASPGAFCSTGSSNLVVSASGTSSTTATIVNYNFNSGSSYTTLSPTLASNVTSTVGSSATFTTKPGTASGGSAFTSNSTAGNSLYATNNGDYWTFTLGGTALSSYSSFAVYFQAERTNGNSSTFTLAYSTNGGTTYSTAGTVTLGNKNNWYEGLFTTLTGTDFPTSGLIFKITNNSSNDVQIDNFEVQAVQQTTTYSWVGLPAPTAGLPAGAGSALTTNNNITVSPTDTTNYTVTVSNGNGCSQTGNVTVNVNPLSVGGTVNSSATVCSGSNGGTLNLTGNTGSVVKWQYSTNGGSTWTDIVNTTTSQTYSNITVATQYRAVVQSGVCSSANSSAATITVNAVSVGGAVNSNATVCSGTNSGTLNLTGNTGNVVKWQYSTNGGSTWIDIANTTTSQTYSNITVATQYRAVVQSGVCSSANSSAATITVNPVSVGGAVNSNATVCSGTNSGTLNLTGNTGSVVKWQYSTNGGSTWTDIVNTTTSQTYSNLTQTTQYRAVVQSGVCSSANSSAAMITVNPVSVGGAVNSNATVCSGTNSGTLNLTGNTGSVAKWQYSTNGGTSWTDIVNTTTSQTYSNLTQTTQYRAVLQSGVCSSANSSAATITVNAVSVGGAVNSNATVCSGTNSGTLNLTGNTGNVIKWQYSTNGGSTWIDIANTTTSQTYSNITMATQYRAVVQSGVCSSANSSAATITVNPVSVGGAVNSSATVCSGTNSGTLNLTGNAGNVVKWQSSTNGGSTWTDIVNTTTSQTYSNITVATQYRAVVQSGVCSSANSSAATITVNPVSVGGAVNSNATVCSGTNSGTVNLTGQTGSVVKWQYSTDGGTTWIDIANTTTSQTYSNLTQTTIGRAVVQSGVCASVFSIPVTITVVAPGSWTGSTSTNWNDSRNWLCGQIPTSNIDVTISAGASYYPNITSGTSTARNITIQSGGSLTVAGGDLQVFGAITNNSGTFDATAGTIEMKGASAQTIDGSAFYNNSINNLIVSNTGSGLSVSSTASDTLKITGSLTFGNSGSTLNTGDNITLVSNSAGTANVGIVGAGNTINGNVTVERYINVGTAAGQHAKSWQFLATPTIGQTVKESWMENGNTPVGYGTQITGTGTGFDATTSAPSLKYYNPATNAWVGVTNTNNSIYNPSGYMVFVRGDRSVTSVSQPANTTTLRTKGALLTGTLTPISVTPDEYASIGNPYASPVDFTLITKGAAIDDQFYVWDPYLYGSYGVGGYQTLSSANEWKPVPGGTSAYPSGTPYYILQSGQAIFVHATSNPSYSAPDYTLTFEENDKSNSPSTNVSRMNGLAPTTSRAFFGVSLYTGNTIADGNTVAFDRSYSDNVDGNDALKLINGGENFGLKRNGKLLAIEARSPVAVTDTLYYYMTNLQQKTYQLRFAPVNMGTTGLQAYLLDNFLNTNTPLSLSDSSFINITVTSNPASSATGRFEVIFRTLSITPVTFTSITAVQKNADIEVDWKVENESGIQQYEVEESGDGNQFTQVATVAPQNNGSGNYSWLDLNVTPGYHYYRVRSVGLDGQVQYTQIVKVLIGKMNASFSVYPNPIVNGNIHLEFNNEPAGVYGVRLMNSLGQIIVQKIVNHGGGNSMEEITPGQTLAKGIYQLEVTKPYGNVEVIKVIN